MELKLNREEITASEVIFDGTQEQSVELDYVLPDYYPEIFKIIKCIVTPRVLSFSVSQDRLTYELSVCTKVLYCAEDRAGVQVVDQKQTYTKTADLGRVGINPRVIISPRTDFCNCRAVNQRRIDIRGAVSIKIRVTDLCKREVVSDAFGMDIQLRKTPVTYPVNKLYTTKRVTVTDEFDLGLSKPPIENLLRSDAVVASTDKKVIANKLVAKGEVYVNMLYTCDKDNSGGIESMQFTVPFSQIIDLDGIDERFECMVDTDVISCELSPHSDADGNSKIIECTLVLLITCQAHRIATVDLVTDHYSMLYKSSGIKSDIKLELPPQTINQPHVVKGALEYESGGLDSIFDVWANVPMFTVKPAPEEKQLIIAGTVCFTVMVRDKEGDMAVLDKDEPFVLSLPMEGVNEATTAELRILPVSCSYNMASDNTVEAKAELRITGNVISSAILPAITDIAVNTEEPVKRDGDFALRLYFAGENEDLWEIAKKYGTSIAAIMEENEIEAEIIQFAGMILIPIL
ncbi:MAG: DUF3794 domain-containing protein [Oscillospiraceae bacterium]|nr:DUF3794 domain-containing protein [Oscillospiraceae bacterium]